MGTYTEFSFKATLKKTTPEFVINFLKKVIIENNIGIATVLFKTEDVPKVLEIDHVFFKAERWYMLLLSTNFGITSGSTLTFNKRWTITVHTEFKNHDDEIEKFIDFISPFIEGRKKKQFLGWSLRETSSEKENIYLINK